MAALSSSDSSFFAWYVYVSSYGQVEEVVEAEVVDRGQKVAEVEL
jgi:hypothetical protein